MAIRVVIVTLLLTLCFSIPKKSVAQHANHWIFGENVHLEFAGDSILQHKISGVGSLLEGTSSYSDDSGILKYYVADDYVRNIKYQRINPLIAVNYTSTQGIIIAKHKEDSVFLFMTSMRVGNSRWNRLQDDTFNVNLKLFAFVGGEKQQAVNHQNQRDIWYANHAQNGDSIFFFLIKKEGLIECPVVTHTGLNYTGGDMGWSTQGQIKFSPNGSYLAECVTVDPFGVGIYRFNTEYPQTDSIYIYSKGFTTNYGKRWPYGLEFSPNNASVFIGTETYAQMSPDPQLIYQLVLDSLVKDKQGSSWILIDSLTEVDFGALQMAPNGKIYHAAPGKKYLGVINNPNGIGANCNYDNQGLTLDSGGTSLYGLPTFNQSYFYHPAIEFSYQEDCFTNEYFLEAKDTFNATSFNWRFTNLHTGKTESKTGKSTTYTLNSDSLINPYRVTLVANSSTKTDSISKTITIRPKLTNTFLGNDTFYCARRSLGEGEQFKLTLRTPKNMHCIHWMGEEPEAKLGIEDSIIRGYEHFHQDQLLVDTAGQYTVRITNKAFCRAYDTIRVEEKPNPDRPLLSINKHVIRSSLKASKYLWFRNDSLVAETNADSLVIYSNGNYQLQLTSEFGCKSLNSNAVSVNFDHISELKKLRFTLYPNPSDGNIIVKLASNATGKAIVYSVDGKVLLTSNFSNQYQLTFNIPVAGTYVLHIESGDGLFGHEIFSVR